MEADEEASTFHILWLSSVGVGARRLSKAMACSPGFGREHRHVGLLQVDRVMWSSHGWGSRGGLGRGLSRWCEIVEWVGWLVGGVPKVAWRLAVRVSAMLAW
jgi:hypothetical protein